jgi:hypothetical protein
MRLAIDRGKKILHDTSSWEAGRMANLIWKQLLIVSQIRILGAASQIVALLFHLHTLTAITRSALETVLAAVLTLIELSRGGFFARFDHR